MNKQDKNNVKKELSQEQINELLTTVKNFAMTDAIFEPSSEEYEHLPLLLKDPTGWGRTEGCPLAIPLFYNENQNYKKPNRGKNKDPEQKYEFLSEQLHNGKTYDWAILTAVKRFIKTQSVLLYKKDNAIVAFEGNAKGTKRYAQKQMYRVAQHARIAKKTKPYTMFLTLTQRVEVGKQDIVKQWQSFGENVKLLCDLLQRKYSIEYERVAEATNNGYRHEHIVLHFDKEPCKMFTRKFKNSELVFGGELRSFIKNHWTLGTSKLEISSKRSPIGYLLKYIGKCAYTDFSEIAKQETPLTKEQRKQLLTIFCSIIAKVRQCNLSEIPGELFEEEEEEDNPQQNALKNSNNAVAQHAPGGRGLDTLSINFKMPCQNLLRFLNYTKFKEETGGEIADFDALEQENKEKIYKRGKCNGCSGCIITHILNEIQNGNDDWFYKTKERAAKKEIDVEKTVNNIEKKLDNGANAVDLIVEELAVEKWKNEENNENNTCTTAKSMIEYKQEENHKANYLNDYDERAKPFVATIDVLRNTAFWEPQQSEVNWVKAEWAWRDEYKQVNSQWSGAKEVLPR